MSEPDTTTARKQQALVAALSRALYERGSWTGETHIQKSAYIATEIAGLDLNYSFTLYKYGPFSFELRETLDEMRAEGFLGVEPVAGYGPRLGVTDRADQQLLARWPRTIARHRAAIDFVAANVADRGVGELERLATALWVRRSQPDDPLLAQAEQVNRIKPHVSVDDALAAMRELDEWEQEAASLGP